MRKFLLLASVAVAFSASAAVEVGFMDAEALGLSGKPTLDDNTLLCSTESAAMYFAYGQETSLQQPAFNGFKTVVFDGEPAALVAGIGGTANGVCNLNDGPSAGGCIYRIEVKKDGWIAVPSKISSNKNFWVWEGLVGEDPLCVAYTLGMNIQSADYPDLHEIVYSLPADADGYLDQASADIDKYTFGGTSIAWPIRIATGVADAASAGNGTGMIIFPVYAEAGNYLVFAQGSKMNTCGYLFSDKNPAGEMPSAGAMYNYSEGDEGYNPAVTNLVISGSPFAGVENVAIDAVVDENAPVYNIYGQRVAKNTKGLLIQNGVKFYNR